MAFLTLVIQGRGADRRARSAAGGQFSRRGRAELGGRAAGFLELPTLFWLDASDALHRRRRLDRRRAVARGAARLRERAGDGGAVGALHLRSSPSVRTSMRYGWEIQLVETGFLAIFLCPLVDGRPFPRRAAAARRSSGSCAGWRSGSCSGAGLIKLRGDPCWRDLTCLDFHFETQPIPNPLSAAVPSPAARWFHKLGVAVQPPGRAGRRRSSCSVRARVPLRRGRAHGRASRSCSSPAATCRSSTG